MNNLEKYFWGGELFYWFDCVDPVGQMYLDCGPGASTMHCMPCTSRLPISIVGKSLFWPMVPEVESIMKREAGQQTTGTEIERAHLKHTQEGESEVEMGQGCEP